MENKSESKKCFEDGQFAVQGLIAGMKAEPNTKIVNGIKKITEGANKVENKIYNDDVERVVNEALKTKHAAKMAKIEKKRKKMILKSIGLATIGLVFALFGICKWLVAWLAFPLFFGFVMYATFCFGRFFENGKCWGWK